ncbi:MAG: hypothetical protein ACLGPL_07100 [Acidobacteriota bacterium]
MRTISSQRFLDEDVVSRKMKLPRDMLVVRVLDVTLRGALYRVILDGHHAHEAARRRGVPPVFKKPDGMIRRMQRDNPDGFERFLINNLTDSEWYDVLTGEVVVELLGREP